MEEAALSTLRCIIEAPVESSLYSCDLPKCLQFLASVTMMAESNESEIHRNLALKIIPYLSSDIDIRSKEIYSKFLSYMDAPLFDADAVKRYDELLENTETNGLKTVRANITKYLLKLRNIYNGNTTDSLATGTQATISITSSSAIATTHSRLSTINPRIEMNLSKIDEVESLPPTSPLTNPIENGILPSSTPINKSRRGVRRLSDHTTTEQRGSLSYHISDKDTDSQGSEVVSELDVQNHASNHISEAYADIGIPTIDLERKDSEKTKENNPNDKTSPRRRNTSNKRLHNTENEYCAQGIDADPSNQNHNCPQKKRRLSMRLNPHNKTDTIRHDNDFVQMQIQSSSSSQSSGSSVSSKKRARPSKQERENYNTQTTAGHCDRLSGRRNSNSSHFDNCPVVTVDAQIHHSMNSYGKSDSDTGSSTPRSSCRKRRRFINLDGSILTSDCATRNNGQTVTRNGRINRSKSKLQSIENDFDAIDIVTASSSSD